MHVSNSLQAVNIPTYHYVGIDLHSTNAVVCVKVNAVDKPGALVGKTIYRGTVNIYDGTEASRNACNATVTTCLTRQLLNHHTTGMR